MTGEFDFPRLANLSHEGRRPRGVVAYKDSYVYDNFGPCQHGDPYRGDE